LAGTIGSMTHCALGFEKTLARFLRARGQTEEQSQSDCRSARYQPVRIANDHDTLRCARFLNPCVQLHYCTLSQLKKRISQKE